MDATKPSTLDHTPPTATEKSKTYNRRSLTKRGPKSFRPGQGTTGPTKARKKRLVFSITSSDLIGTDEEMAKVRGLASQISQVPDVGKVTTCGIVEGSWEVAIALDNPLEVSDDELLSDAFRKLDTVITGSPVLQQGFVSAKPTWQFMLGDFVADKGGFV
jgi:hypothetical protein